LAGLTALVFEDNEEARRNYGGPENIELNFVV
jgi:hypothetical protein